MPQNPLKNINIKILGMFGNQMATVLLYVVYFDQLLGAAHIQKLVELLFSAVFNLFYSFKTFLSDFSSEINKKHLKINKKNLYLSTPQSWSTCMFPQICLFSVDFLLLLNHQIWVIFKDHNFDLAEAGIEPRATGWQSSALPSELFDLKLL